MTKSLYVMRHAKSSWKDLSVPDFERPLAPRGERAARSMGHWLKSARPLPELILCSTATRAVRTCQLITRSLGSSVQVHFEDGLYGASGTALLARLHGLPDKVKSVLLIGHNPGVQDLLIELANEGDPVRLVEVRAGFPTCAVATLRVNGHWSELGTCTARVKDLVTPSTLSL